MKSKSNTREIERTIKLRAKGVEKKGKRPRARTGKSAFIRVLQFDAVTRVDLHSGFAADKFIRLAIRRGAGVTFTVAKRYIGDPLASSPRVAERGSVYKDKQNPKCSSRDSKMTQFTFTCARLIR